MDATNLYESGAVGCYDAFHADYAGDLPFYLKVARRRPGPVLELACGSGRVGIELLKVGVNYTGIDYSEAMLEEFRKKWRAQGGAEPADLRQGDMRRFNLECRFESILITHNSLQHVHRNEEVLQVLANCRSHLTADGCLIFDVFNPDRRFLDRDPEKRYPVSKFLDEARGLWCEAEESNRYDASSKVNRITWFFRYENGEERTFRLEMRQFFPQEMDALVTRAGFRIVNKWGDFVNSGFTSASPRQIFECQMQ